MIGYTMVGTNDLERSLSFYDPIFEAMGLDQCWRDGRSASWGRRDDESYPRFFTGRPFDGEQASVGNGSMTAFLIDDARLIDRLYELALSNGGSDAGRPGRRPQYGEGFYGAYVRDPDGNKLAFVCYDA
jgi:catechol 2,3-dioxygenase-like lactoylglutathione lyase family enzyme